MTFYYALLFVNSALLRVSGAHESVAAAKSRANSGGEERVVPQPSSFASVREGRRLRTAQHVQAGDQRKGTQSVRRLAPVVASTFLAGCHGERTACGWRALHCSGLHADLAFGNYDAVSSVALSKLFRCYVRLFSFVHVLISMYKRTTSKRWFSFWFSLPFFQALCVFSAGVCFALVLQ